MFDKQKLGQKSGQLQLGLARQHDTGTAERERAARKLELNKQQQFGCYGLLGVRWRGDHRRLSSYCHRKYYITDNI